MAYTKYPWTAGKTTPINATNLNHIEDGIYDAHEMATGRAATLVVAANDSSALAKQQADYVCDGTDDNVQIQAALNALSSAGGTVLLMEGNYLSEQILIPSDAVFRGVGMGTALKMENAINDRFIENSDRLGGNSNICIESMYIDGNKANQTVIGPADAFGNAGCLDFRNVTDLTVRNCTIVEGWGAGIETTLCNNIFAIGNRIDRPADDGIGINDQSLYANVTNNIITSAGQGDNFGAPYGIEVQDGARFINVSNNVLKDCLDGAIQVSSHVGGTSCQNVSIIGNSINNDGATDSVGFDLTANGAANKNIAIIGNNINNERSGTNAYTCMELKASNDQLTVIGNICLNALGYGINLYSNDGILSENVFDTCVTGIRLRAGSTDVAVSCNQFIGCTTEINNEGTTPSIFRNKGFVTENSGTATLVSGTTSIAVNHGLAVTPVAGDIVVTPIEAWGSMTQFYIDTYTSTQFTIHADQNPTQDVDFAWKAIAL